MKQIRVIKKGGGEERLIPAPTGSEIWAGTKFSQVNIGADLSPVITTNLPEGVGIASHMHGWRPRFTVVAAK